MVWSQVETMICKKHPQHRQQTGVCSCCLREKLNQLSLSPPPSNMIRTLVAVSSFSANSSYTSSGSVSPVHHGHRRHSSIGGPVGFIISTAGTGLKKSRSIAFIATRGGGGVDHDHDHDHVKNKKGSSAASGFWKKLIRSTGKGTKRVFMHSRTVKERSDAHYQL